tara:strand:+ start:672 stop:1259 length:588 start_codon:yes stop_codon:yes gene_type:complete
MFDSLFSGIGDFANDVGDFFSGFFGEDQIDKGYLSDIEEDGDIDLTSLEILKREEKEDESPSFFNFGFDDVKKGIESLTDSKLGDALKGITGAVASKGSPLRGGREVKSPRTVGGGRFAQSRGMSDARQVQGRIASDLASSSSRAMAAAQALSRQNRLALSEIRDSLTMPKPSGATIKLGSAPSIGIKNNRISLA